MTIDPATQEEIDRLSQAVDEFSAEMKARLREQALKGYRGWYNLEQYQEILDMMMQRAAVAEGEEVDAANLAMIPWSLRRRRSGEQGQSGAGTGAIRFLPWNCSSHRKALRPRPQSAEPSQLGRRDIPKCAGKTR